MKMGSNIQCCAEKNVMECVICGKKFKRKGKHRKTCSKRCSRVYMRSFRVDYAKEYRKKTSKKKQKEAKNYFEIYQNYIWYMNADLSQYNGEWVCIHNQRVIVHSKKIKDIMQYIEDHMLKNFTISRVDTRLRI